MRFETEVEILDRLFWDIQPALGDLAGQAYCETMSFGQGHPDDPGHRADLLVVVAEGRLRHVAFLETCSP